MSAGVCHLCFEESKQMKENFQESLQHTDSQDFVEHFCQFIFQDSASTIEEICQKCWNTLQQFNTFCEKIRGIHQSLIDVSIATAPNKSEDHQIEILEDDDTEVIVDDIHVVDLPLLSIESNLGVDIKCPSTVGDGIHRGTLLTPKIIQNLEEQLNFKAKVVYLAEMDFDRFARFMTMDCALCKYQFLSFDECYEHFLVVHKRSAFWNCCNLLLETPYDVLDHIRYHESIEDFKCAACFKCFLTTNKLKYHIRRAHLPVVGSLACIFCDREFRNLRLLLNHQKSHIRIDCPHCMKHISAANYDHHVRSVHANETPRKRKPAAKKDWPIKREKIDVKIETQTSKPASTLSATKNSPARKLNIKTEPNANGMYECDICNMEFKQISLVFSHRNKVHV